MSTSTAPRAEQPRRVAARIDAAVDRVRTALGPSYLYGLVITTGILVSWVSTPFQNLTQVPFWTSGFDEWWYVGIFAGLATVAAPFVLVLILLRRHRAVAAHLRGHAVDPVLVWRDCVTRLPMTAVLVSLVWGGFTVGLGVVLVGRREDFTASTYVGAYAAELLVTAGVTAFYLLIFELALRPIAREVAVRLPDDFADRAVVSARRRLILLNTVVTFTVGCQAAGLSVGLSEGRGMPWIVLVVTLGLVFTFVGAQLSLVATSVSRRVDELADALNGVASGLPAIRILPTSGDEFDAVGRAFNQMVDLLDGHAEELRRSRARLVEVADEARRVIERDLHDGAQQSLALVSMQLGQLGSGCAALPAAERVGAIRADLGAVVAEMRALAHGIYPASLEAEGVTSALRAAARESDLMVAVDATLRSRWSHAIETAVYFCCWEVLQRAGHMDDPSVRIALREVPGAAVVEIVMRPGMTDDQAADLTLFLQDRLGAVGGTVVSSASPDELGYRGEVPTA